MKVRIFTLIVVTSLVVGGVAGVATAHPNAGASSECDDNTERGDGQATEFSNDSDPPSGSEVVIFSGNVVEFFAAGGPLTDNPCDDEEGDDYIEVHASGGDSGIQACYSDANDRNFPSGDNVKTGHKDTGYCSQSQEGDK